MIAVSSTRGKKINISFAILQKIYLIKVEACGNFNKNLTKKIRYFQINNMLKGFHKILTPIFFVFQLKSVYITVRCNKQQQHIKYNYKLSFNIVLTVFLCLIFVLLCKNSIFV